LFGPPLLALGAVSPVLIALIDLRRPGAGSAAGRLFFTNTMGGLAGGWLTAFAIIPHSSLRVALVATGVALLLLALLWVIAARSALQLGLGAGLLPTDLSHRGLSVTAVEIEPRIEELARTYFDLPDKVIVHIADARAFLRHDSATYDLILLDTFASESTPWHMLTLEALREMRSRLTPGGRLVINTVSYADTDRPSLQGIESTAVAAFGEAMVYPGVPESDDPDELVNVLI